MGRTKQVVHKSESPIKVKLEKVKLEKNGDDSNPDAPVELKTEKVEIINTSSQHLKRKARKTLNPRKFEAERRKLYEQTFIFPRRPFSNLVREIANDFANPELFGENGVRFDRKAIDMLQTISEEYLTNIFEDCAMISEIANRKTIKDRDMKGVLGIYDRCAKRPLTGHEKEYVNYLYKRNTKKPRNSKAADNEEKAANSDSDDDQDEDYDPKKDNSTKELQDDEEYFQNTPEVVKSKSDKISSNIEKMKKIRKSLITPIKKESNVRHEDDTLDPASDDFDPRDL